MQTPLEKIAQYSQGMFETVKDIAKYPENRAGLIKRLNDHFEVLEDAMFELNDEDLIVPSTEEITMEDVDIVFSRPKRSTRTVEDFDETPDTEEEVYLGGQSDE